jgi:hypothetical protein
MTWIRANKFLSGFIGVMVVAVGALGYLLYSAYSNYSDVSDQYTQTESDLHGLQNRVPFPNTDNLAKYRAQKDDFIDATHDLADNLSKMEMPLEDLTPSAFQDKLRESVSAVTARAKGVNVKLPDKFAMDFDQYESVQPVPQAASPLGRQLAAIEAAMNILIDDHVDAITAMTRTKVPQEASTAPGVPGAPGAGAHATTGGLVDKVPFQVSFTATQGSFNKVLNDLAASDKQFFITRTLVIENSQPKPVSKADAAAAQAAAAATPAPAAGGGGAPATTGTDASASAGVPANTSFLTFLVGTEKVDVAMRVDMVTFNPPDKAARKGAPGNN